MIITQCTRKMMVTMECWLRFRRMRKRWGRCQSLRDIFTVGVKFDSPDPNKALFSLNFQILERKRVHFFFAFLGLMILHRRYSIWKRAQASLLCNRCFNGDVKSIHAHINALYETFTIVICNVLYKLLLCMHFVCLFQIHRKIKIEPIRKI